ncbi:MAG TPA: hypothetical protein VNI83_13495 [Vicinamibacterales bacterium]|nr:hypothetical protein [Vicinamibacterales bacterium]
MKTLAIALSLAGLAIGATSAVAMVNPPAGQTRPDQAPAKPEVFCEGKSAGQLCLHGTIDTLRLDDARRERWRAAGRKYNEAVEQATRQLLAEVRTFLSPEQYAMVERWFDKELNAMLNRYLLGDGSASRPGRSR